MRMYVVDVANSLPGKDKLIVHPADEWTGKVNHLYSTYLDVGKQPYDGMIVGFWHPTSKKRVRKWVMFNTSVVKTYVDALDRLGVKDEVVRKCNKLISKVEEQGDAAEISLVHSQLV